VHTGGDLAEKIGGEYRRFVPFELEVAQEGADVLALWTMHTWVTGAARVTPYIAVLAPGTRVLEAQLTIEVARYLVRGGKVAKTFSKIRYQRAPEDFTLLVNDANALRSSHALRATLSDAHRRRTILMPTMFLTFRSPKTPPPREIGSRYIPIPIRAVPRSDGDANVGWPLDRLYRREYTRESAPLREALGVWSEETLDRLVDAHPEIPHGLSRSRGEVWAPLLAIADSLGGDWPNRAAKAIVLYKRSPAPGERGDDPYHPHPSEPPTTASPERPGRKQRVRAGHNEPTEGVSETDPDAIGADARTAPTPTVLDEAAAAEREAELLNAGRKVDPSQRDQIGAAGEEAVLREYRMGLSAIEAEERLRRVSLESDELGYDITVRRDDDCYHRLEVKTTVASGPLDVHITRNEASCMHLAGWKLVVCRHQPPDNTVIVGWCYASAIPSLPENTHPRAAWDSVEVELKQEDLTEGVPPISSSAPLVD
jgi:hypothetical protein